MSARTAAGLSYEAVAAACSVTSQTVRNWEDGKGDPGLRRVEALCSVLKVTPTWLIFGREKGARS